MQQLNLVDPRLLPPRHLLSGTRLLAVAALGLVLTAAHFGVEQHRLAQVLLAAGMSPQDEATPEAAPADPDAAVATRIVQRQALRDMLAKADRLPNDSAATLQSVIGALPETVWLTEVDVLGAQGVRIAGGTTDPASLRTLADRLAGIPLLSGVPVETLRIEPVASEDTSEERTPSSHSFVLASAGFVALEAGR